MLHTMPRKVTVMTTVNQHSNFVQTYILAAPAEIAQYQQDIEAALNSIVQDRPAGFVFLASMRTSFVSITTMADFIETRGTHPAFHGVEFTQLPAGQMKLRKNLALLADVENGQKSNIGKNIKLICKYLQFYQMDEHGTARLDSFVLFDLAKD